VSELAGRRDIVTGLQVNGRPESVDGDRVIGMFNNIVPLRSTVDGGTWAELVEQAASHEARIGPHRRFPLVEAQRRFGAADLFDTLFVFTHFHAYRALTGITGLHAPDQTYLPLTAHANVDAWSGQVRLLLEFDPREFGRDQVAEIGTRYAEALAAIVAAPHAARPVAAEPPVDRLDELLRRLEGLSDDEAQELVERMR
jgi:nonribosomal peptide synthetase protein BlmVI